MMLTTRHCTLGISQHHVLFTPHSLVFTFPSSLLASLIPVDE